MNSSPTPQIKGIALTKYWILLLVGWTLAVGTSLYWSIVHLRTVAEQNAIVEARAHIENDNYYRDWAFNAGGIYVAESPALKRDSSLWSEAKPTLEAKSGENLVYIPASKMTRLVHQEEQARGHIPGKFASLRPLSSVNSADAWETEALKKFASGEVEANKIETSDSTEYLRIAAPIYMEQKCQSCHTPASGPDSSILAAAVERVALAPFLEISAIEIKSSSLRHGILWLLGVVAGIVGGQRIRMHERERLRAELLLSESEHKFRTIADVTWDWEGWVAPDGSLVYTSPSCERITGYSAAEFMAKPSLLADIAIKSENEPAASHLLEVGMQEHCTFDYRIVTKSGDKRWIAHECRPIVDEYGVFQGRRFGNRDITDRKREQAAATVRAQILKDALNQPANSIMQTVLDKAEELTESCIGFFHFMDPDQKSLQLDSWSTRTVNEFCTASAKGSHYPLGLAGVWADSARTKCAQTCNDYEHLAHKRGLPPGHAAVTRFISVPIVRGNIVVAIIGIGNKPRDYTEEDVAIVTHLADLCWDIIERKRAEEFLIASESKYRSLFTEMSFGAGLHKLVCDESGNPIDYTTIDINSAFETLIGVNREDVVDRRASQFMSPEELKHWLSIFAPVALSGESVSYETYSERNQRYFEGRCFSPEKGRFVAMFTDITDRKKAEIALRESEEQFRRLYFETPAMLHSIDATGHIVSVSDLWLAKMGYEFHEVIGRKSTEFLTEESAKYAKEFVIPEFFRIGYCSNIPYQFVKKNGELMDVLLSATSEKNSEGAVLRSMAVLEDVTARKRAEELKRKSEEEYRLIFESAPNLIIAVDCDCRLVDCNQRIESILGYSKSDLMGRNVCDIVHPDFTSQAQDNMSRLFEGHDSAFDELQMIRKDGTVIDARVNFSTLKDADGTISRAVCMIQDVTESKRLQELESRSQRLETAGTIAGQVAHDFNNLLAPIMAYPEFIKDEIPEGNQAHKWLAQIEHAAKQLADINQDLLTMSRSGHYNLQVINLNQAVRNAISEIEPRTKSVSVVLNLSPDLMNMKGGAAQIHRMLINLMVNALDAMQDSGTLTVRTENYYSDETSVAYGVVPKGEYVKLTISDTGCGIPEQIVNKILDPFFTTKSTDKKRGSGLGMSIVDSVIRDHGGYLDLKSTVGQGTSFFIYLPITRDQVAAAVSDAVQGGGESVLIIDDDDIQRQVTSGILTKLGYSVTSAESGEKAIALLRETKFDLLILDMIMSPGIDGTETYRRAIALNSEQRAILLSGYAETDRVSEAQFLGAGAFVKKPVTRKTIAAAIRQELDRKVATPVS